MILTELCPHALASHGHHWSEFVDFFKGIGYRFFDEKTFSPIVHDGDAWVKTIPPAGSINVLAAVEAGVGR